MNRSDAVRAGLDKVFAEHDEEIDQVRTALGASVLGSARIDRRRLEHAIAEDKALDYKVIGILTIDSDVTPELALKGVHDIFLLGSLRGPKPVIEALSARIRRRPF